MINRPASAERSVVPVHVWTRLAADRRARAIHLMAQLAFNLVLAQSDLIAKETKHVKSTRYTQNPARTP